MKRRRFAFDLILALIAVLALLAPLLQLAAAVHIERTETQIQRQYTRICNVEGNLCVTEAAAAGRPFGRLLPGY